MKGTDEVRLQGGWWLKEARLEVAGEMVKAIGEEEPEGSREKEERKRRIDRETGLEKWGVRGVGESLIKEKGSGSLILFDQRLRLVRSWAGLV